ncbi:MAG: M1 family metallopeptidase [Gemmatimonadaceae bacterium]
MQTRVAISLAILLATWPHASTTAQAQPPRNEYHRGIDVLHYELTLDLPDSGSVIEGRARLSVHRTTADTLRLDLLRLRVDSVLVNGVATRFARDSATLRIPLPARSNDTLTVAVRYGGKITDGFIVRTDSMGRWTGFGDNWPNRGRNWIPSVDHPSDKATVTWIVRAPSERRVVANGVLTEESPLPSLSRGSVPRTLTRWHESKAIPVYLMVIGAAPLAYYDLGRTACGLSEMPGCVPQSVYVAPEQREFLPGPFSQAGDIVEFFSELVGPYPYEKLAHVQSSTRFGGMENASAIFYSDRAFRQKTLGTGLVAHETAHQWFGNSVTEREWAHLWLSEGFASYWQQLWERKTSGQDSFRVSMAALRKQIVESAVSARRPVIDTAETNYLELLNTNSYQKGAWTLHMLRVLVGDSAFFTGVRSYYELHKHGTALTVDLQRAMERASGKELGWFFDQWLRRPGFAELRTRWNYDANRGIVVIEVEQSDRFAPYRFPLTVEVIDANGIARRSTLDVAPTRKQRLTLEAVRARPRRIVFDPGVELLATFDEG